VTSLAAGQASLHHGWTLHSSKPNTSDDRRIGLNIQYIRPEVRQIKQDYDSAMLVRGVDQYHHFHQDRPAQTAFDLDAWHYQQDLDANLKAIQGNTSQ
jgi:hypothetical protein